MLEKRDGNSIVIVSTDNWNLGDISAPMITLRYMIVYVVHSRNIAITSKLDT